MARRKTLTLDDILQPGISFSVFWNEGNINNQRVHVRAIVDDEVVVYRAWGRHKSRWYYETKDAYWFKLLLDEGVIRRVRRDKDHLRPIYETRLEGNNGGDIFEITDLGNGLVDFRSGHCCVLDIERVVPVEFLTCAINRALINYGSAEGVLRESGWPEDFVEELSEKVDRAEQEKD